LPRTTFSNITTEAAPTALTKDIGVLQVLDLVLQPLDRSTEGAALALQPRHGALEPLDAPAPLALRRLLLAPDPPHLQIERFRRGQPALGLARGALELGVRDDALRVELAEAISVPARLRGYGRRLARLRARLIEPLPRSGDRLV
jgi:hypothetical protein